MFRFCVVLLMGCLLSHASALAQQMAVVDMEKVFSEAKVVVDIRKQMDAAKIKAEQEIDTLEHKARDQAEQLEKDKEKIPHRDYVDRQETIQKQVVAWQDLADKRKAQLDDAYGNAMEQVKERVTKIMATVAEERKIALIIPAQQVAFANPNLTPDVTSRVMDQLNQEFATFKVNLPKD